MPSESPFARALWPACLAVALAACAAPARPPAPAPEPMRVMVLPSPAPEPARPPAAAPAAHNGTHPLEAALAYAERVRALPAAELAQELQRLGDSSYAPQRAIQLALALAQSRTAAGTARAQSLLQRVQSDPGPEAQALHPFARLLSAQIAEQRRTDEQAERHAQQLREAQRRIEQLNERLEAVRAIERSLPGAGAPRPTAPAAR